MNKGKGSMSVGTTGGLNWDTCTPKIKTPNSAKICVNTVQKSFQYERIQERKEVIYLAFQ